MHKVPALQLQPRFRDKLKELKENRAIARSRVAEKVALLTARNMSHVCGAVDIRIDL